MNKNFSVRLDKADQERLEAWAKKERRPDAQMIRVLLQEAMDARDKAQQERVPA